jgi:hypothetical protein
VLSNRANAIDASGAGASSAGDARPRVRLASMASESGFPLGNADAAMVAEAVFR